MQNGLLVKYFNSRNITIGDIEVNKNYMNSFMPKRNHFSITFLPFLVPIIPYHLLYLWMRYENANIFCLTLHVHTHTGI